MATSRDIITKRLIITPFTEAHITPRYLGWLNDRDLMRFSSQRYTQHTPGSCRSYLQSFDNTPNYFWAIIEQPKHLAHIGNINAYIDPRNNIADIGIVVGESAARGGKYALEAWLGVCGFLFDECNIRKITAGTAEDNIAMQKLMKSAGMVDDGIRKKHLCIDGNEVDIIHRALFRDQWIQSGIRPEYSVLFQGESKNT